MALQEACYLDSDSSVETAGTLRPPLGQRRRWLLGALAASAFLLLLVFAWAGARKKQPLFPALAIVGTATCLIILRTTALYVSRCSWNDTSIELRTLPRRQIIHWDQIEDYERRDDKFILRGQDGSRLKINFEKLHNPEPLWIYLYSRLGSIIDRKLEEVRHHPTHRFSRTVLLQGSCLHVKNRVIDLNDVVLIETGDDFRLYGRDKVCVQVPYTSRNTDLLANLIGQYAPQALWLNEGSEKSGYPNETIESEVGRLARLRRYHERINKVENSLAAGVTSLSYAIAGFWLGHLYLAALLILLTLIAVIKLTQWKKRLEMRIESARNKLIDLVRLHIDGEQ